MTPQAPAPVPTPVVPAITLPRPNPGPLPWSEPAPVGASPLGGGLGVGLAVAALLIGGLAIRRHWRGRRGEADPPTPPGGWDEADSPTHRLRLAAQTVRAALITAFGPTWNARTTEEVARDPALPARFGPELAEGVVAFLQRVDRVRFGGEICNDVDFLVDSAQPLVDRLRVGGPPGAELTSRRVTRGGSGGRRRRWSRSR